MMKLVAAKCPSCGANINVDRSLKFTKCEYCNTEILVEEAVENLLKVELKDSPSLDNYLKLGNRYYENQEFEEAYKVYSKAEEIDPDNPIVVLRRGLCRCMVSDYNNLDIMAAINGMKTSYELMKKMRLSKQDINQSINDTGTVLYLTKKYIVDVYNRNQLNKEQTKGYIERLEKCLDGYLYLDQIVDGDSELEEKIVHSIIEIIDIILGNANNSKYQLSSSYMNELKAKKKEYLNRVGKTSYSVKNTISKEKVVGVESKTSIVWDIVCYITIFFLFIMFLGSLFNGESFITIFTWFFAIISFIPPLKRFLMKKFGSNMGMIVIIVRVILLLGAFILLASGPVEFENTFKGEDGTTIILKEGKVSITKEDTVIQGTYHWDTKDNDYYIHVQGKNLDEDMEYRYRPSEDGGSLCLLENDQCSMIYLPVK